MAERVGRVGGVIEDSGDPPAQLQDDNSEQFRLALWVFLQLGVGLGEVVPPGLGRRSRAPGIPVLGPATRKRGPLANERGLRQGPGAQALAPLRRRPPPSRSSSPGRPLPRRLGPRASPLRISAGPLRAGRSTNAAGALGWQLTSAAQTCSAYRQEARQGEGEAKRLKGLHRPRAARHRRASAPPCCT
jgi:hypothetical protein